MTDHAPREATASSIVRAEITEIEKAELLNAMRQATGETVTLSRAAVDLCRRLCLAHDAAIAELVDLKARKRPDRVVQHDHGDVGVTYANCIGCIADQLGAARAEVEQLKAERRDHELNVMGWDEDVKQAERERDAAIRDRNEFAAAQLERFVEEHYAREPFVPVSESAKIRAAELRKAAPAALPAAPSISALIQGAEDAAVEWGKCVGDYHAACRVAPPPSPREACDAVRESGRKCELAWGALRKAIRAVAAPAAAPAEPTTLERFRDEWLNQPLTAEEKASTDFAGRKLERWDEAFKEATPPADLHQAPAGDPVEFGAEADREIAKLRSDLECSDHNLDVCLDELAAERSKVADLRARLAAAEKAMANLVRAARDYRDANASPVAGRSTLELLCEAIIAAERADAVAAEPGEPRKSR